MRISDWSSDVALPIAPGRVPMHNDLAEIRVRLEERRADPNQIVRVLGFERHAWPHAGMDEQIIAEGNGELECLEEIAMGLRQREIGSASCRERVCQYV